MALDKYLDTLPAPSYRLTRRLGNIESSWSMFYDIAPINAVTVLKVRGGLTAALLRQALDYLQYRHPVLRVRIVKLKQGDYTMQSDNVPPIPLLEQTVPDKEAYRLIVGEEYDTPFDYTIGPLFRVRLVHISAEPEACYIVTNYMHTIGDGESVMNLTCEMMQLCQQLVNRGNLLESPLNAELPPADVAELRFPERVKTWAMTRRFATFLLRQFKEEYYYRHKRILTGKRLRLQGVRTGFLELMLPKAEVERALHTAKKHQTNMHGAACAAILLAEYEFYNKKNGTDKPIYLKCSSVVNLRSFLEPPIAAENFGSYVSMVASAHALSTTTDFWALARDIKNELTAGIARDDMFHISMRAHKLAKIIIALDQAVISALSVSNVGRMKFSNDFSPFWVEEYIGNVSNLGGGSDLSVVLNTFGDTMCWSYTYPKPLLSDADAEQIARRAIAILLDNCKE